MSEQMTTFEEFKEHVDSYPEVELYFMIDFLGANIWTIDYDSADGRIEMTKGLEDDRKKLQRMVEYAAGLTENFGVTAARIDGRPSAEYWKWYRWWDKWKKELSTFDWEAVSNLRSKKENIDKYLPKGKWSDSD